MARRPGIFDQFLLATAVLTRLPVAATPPQNGAIGAASWAFPAVGAGIGGIAGAVMIGAALLGLGAAPAGLLALVAAGLVTGALHEDGLADTVDGFGGGRSRDDKLAIMRDSRQGAYGVLALVLSIGLRAAALASIEPLAGALALIAAHAASRAWLPVAMRWLDAARADGLGAGAGRPPAAAASVAAAIGAVLALAALGPLRGLVALALSALAVAGAARLAQRQIGGYTGDVLGAFQQVGEIVMLLVAAAK
ncbi:MAG TPA: adenosylcobinamide-GDP ribazoletransferase [Stellaceae bacterium]|nr:adenosylcobinamide-GDP ribazoletransferase [Stellaceae bacterium]